MPGGASGRRQAAPPVPACGGGTSTPARHPPPHLPHHRLLLPSPPGPQCLGRGEPRRDCALPAAPDPRNANASPPPDPHCHPALRTPEAIAGPRQPGRLVCSCIKLSPCPFLPPPPVFLLVFFPFPPSPASSRSPLGSAQVNGYPPSPPHGSPAHVMFPSLFFLCVFI